MVKKEKKTEKSFLGQSNQLHTRADHLEVGEKCQHGELNERRQREKIN